MASPRGHPFLQPPGEQAGSRSFDTAFYAVQVIELLAGAINLTLMGLTIRDGRAMARRRKTGGTA